MKTISSQCKWTCVLYLQYSILKYTHWHWWLIFLSHLVNLLLKRQVARLHITISMALSIPHSCVRESIYTPTALVLQPGFTYLLKLCHTKCRSKKGVSLLSESLSSLPYDVLRASSESGNTARLPLWYSCDSPDKLGCQADAFLQWPFIPSRGHRHFPSLFP